MIKKKKQTNELKLYIYFAILTKNKLGRNTLGGIRILISHVQS